MATGSVDEQAAGRVAASGPATTSRRAAGTGPACPGCERPIAAPSTWCGHCGALVGDATGGVRSSVRFAAAAGRSPDDRGAGADGRRSPDPTVPVEVTGARPSRLGGATAVLVALAVVAATAQLLPPAPTSAPEDETAAPLVDIGAGLATTPLAWVVGSGAVAVRGGPVVDVSTGQPTATPDPTMTPGATAPSPEARRAVVERPHDQSILVGLDRGEVTASDVRTGRDRWTTELGAPVLELKVVGGALGVLLQADVDGNHVGRLDPARGTLMTLVTGPTTVGTGSVARRWAIDDVGVAVVTTDGVVLTPWRRDASLLAIDGVHEVALAGDHVAVHRRAPPRGDVVELWDRRDRSLVASLPVTDR